MRDQDQHVGRMMPITVAAVVPQAVADADANHDGKISLQARALPLRGSFADCDVIVGPPQSGADDCLRTYRTVIRWRARRQEFIDGVFPKL